MDTNRYEQLTALAVARETARHYNAGRPASEIRRDAQVSLWITASVRLSDEIADEMIAQLEHDIVADALYYASKEEVSA